MGWVEARDQVVSIVEGTTPTTLKRGLPSTFKHYAEATLEEGPDSRAFWLEITKLAHIGPRTPAPSIQGRTRAEGALVVVYRSDADPTLLFEAVASDYLEIVKRLLDPSLQAGQFVTLTMGGDQLLEAEIVQEEGTVAMRINFRMEYRS